MKGTAKPSCVTPQYQVSTECFSILFDSRKVFHCVLERGEGCMGASKKFAFQGRCLKQPNRFPSAENTGIEPNTLRYARLSRTPPSQMALLSKVRLVGVEPTTF